MKAAIVTIGDEILIGQIVDTNSSYIAKALDKIGIATYEMFSISDEKEHIINTLAYFQNKVDVVILTGGLGPTKDDITKKTFCDYFEDELVEDAIVLIKNKHWCLLKLLFYLIKWVLHLVCGCKKKILFMFHCLVCLMK